MKRLTKYYLILLSAVLILGGCGKSPTASNSSTTSKNGTSTGTSQTSSGAVSSINAPAFAPPSSGTAVKGSAIILAGTTIYYCNWSDGDKLYKINVNGTGKQKLSDDASKELILSNNILYYSNKSDYFKLYSINTDGTGKQKILDEKATNLALLGNYLYFIDSVDTIAAFDTTSGIKNSLSVTSRYFDTDGSQIYYDAFSSDTESLNSMNTDGTNQTKINEDIPLGISADQGTIYYVNSNDEGKIYKVSLDGTQKLKLNDFESSDIRVDNGWIYYINHGDYEKLYKMKLDGTGNTKLSDEDFIKAFTISGNFVYFDEDIDLSHPIYKINK